ncbi:HAD family hydrolase [Micromonospora peucetia]|uniref:HAD family hydrolase n=1 Tax=Micromonospora peucetia TaxID=47871 RepID=A0ABZ1EJ39_9ACTN|nr:HAD family hydrolase [Micromonospora peucetia]WSA34256.1 HAD family hydrolase [Micromonospora peucetia]
MATILATASPLRPADARRVIRQQLYTRASIDAAVIAEVCDALQLPASAFPTPVESSPPQLLPGAGAALRSMSRHANVVTLSNVSCLEADTGRLRALLYPWAIDYFPSCRTGYAKPDPAAFHCVATACRTSPANMVHIGDDWACDVIGARTAGVTVIWVSNGRPVPEPEWLKDGGVLVATDLLAASQHLTELATWRRS